MEEKAEVSSYDRVGVNSRILMERMWDGRADLMGEVVRNLYPHSLIHFVPVHLG